MVRQPRPRHDLAMGLLRASGGSIGSSEYYFEIQHAGLYERGVALDAHRASRGMKCCD